MNKHTLYVLALLLYLHLKSSILSTAKRVIYKQHACMSVFINTKCELLILNNDNKKIPRQSKVEFLEVVEEDSQQFMLYYYCWCYLLSSYFVVVVV